METVTAQGVSIPALGVGTARMDDEECRSAVQAALDMGYRHVDTAQMYGNERAVGEAIRGSSVPREEIFLVTKVHRRNLAPDDVLNSVEASLDRLGTHIDLLLIHAPSRTVPIHRSIEAMNELQARGDVSHIGVSNFSVDQLERAIEASRTPIVTNQVEYHPYTDQRDLLEYCIERDIALTAYSPLDLGNVVGDDRLETIGDRYGKTAPQVALRWLLQQRNVVAIPKAASPEHLTENIDIFDFALTDDEMERLFDVGPGLTDRLRDFFPG